MNDDASSHILIGDELLRDIKFDSRRYNTCAWVGLFDPEYPEHCKSECPSCDHIQLAHFGNPLRLSYCFAGMMFHINARNRRLIYRIGNYRPTSRTWEAAWPD